MFYYIHVIILRQHTMELLMDNVTPIVKPMLSIVRDPYVGYDRAELIENLDDMQEAVDVHHQEYRDQMELIGQLKRGNESLSQEVKELKNKLEIIEGSTNAS